MGQTSIFLVEVEPEDMLESTGGTNSFAAKPVASARFSGTLDGTLMYWLNLNQTP